MIGKKAKVIDGFEVDGDRMHQFHEGEIVTLVSIQKFEDSEEETWYHFKDESGIIIQILVESEFEFIEEDGE